MEKALPRVVQVGFNRCATRSLARLFAVSGHASVHHKLKRLPWPSRNVALLMRENIKAGRKVFDGFDHFVFYADLMAQTKSETYEAFKEYRRILKDYPETILLLNYRDREDWIRSRRQHGHGTFLRAVMEAEGIESEEECLESWRRDWETHLSAVRTFMASRPEQLVEFDLDKESVRDLIAKLPNYKLDARAWGDIGRSRDRKLNRFRHAFHKWNAERRLLER